MKNTHFVAVTLCLLTVRYSSAQLSPDHAVDRFRCAERMKYDAVPKPCGSHCHDTLAHNYFSVHAIGQPSSAHDMFGNGYWEIPVSDTHESVIALSGNEYPNSWRNDSSASYRFAVSIQVPVVSLSDTSPILELAAVQLHHFADGAVSFDTETFAIPWNAVAAAGRDVTLFSNLFRFKNGFSYPDDSLMIEVRCRRYTTVRLKWICIEDSLAHELLAGRDLTMDDPLLRGVSEKNRDAITHTLSPTAAVDQSIPTLGELVRCCPRSEWNAYGWVTATARALRHGMPIPVVPLYEQSMPSTVVSTTP